MRLCPACGASLDGRTWQCPSCRASYDTDGPYIDLICDQLGRAEYARPITGIAERLLHPEEGHFWFEERARLVAWMIAKSFPTATNLLDVGCGTGHVLSRIAEQIPHLAISGGDVSGSSLVEARRWLPTVPLYRMAVENVPFESEFDVICCLDVLEHLDDDAKALHEMHRAVKPQGGLVLTVPQHPYLWSSHDLCSGHVRRYTWQSLSKVLSRTGWEVLYTSSFVTFLLPMMIVSRMRVRRARTEVSSLELAPPPIVNTLLRMVMRFERLLLERGARFPVGGSRIVVARRCHG